MNTVTHPVVGLGGTHLRYGFAQRDIVAGKLSGMPRIVGDPVRLKCPLKNGVVDLRNTLSLVANGIKSPIPKGITKFIGIDAPGAWQENGLPYPGSVGNIPELASCKIAEELPAMLGPEWKAAVNNDGVAGVLAIAQSLLSNLDRFPEIQEVLSKHGAKISGFVPGTGFGAGAFLVNKGYARPATGPQQFFDIMLWIGQDLLNSGWTTIETTCSGKGFAFQAMNSLLGKRYAEDTLSGDFIRSLAFSDGTEHPEDEIATALGIYRTAAKGLAETMKLCYRGGHPSISLKAVVNDPHTLETKFWNDVRNTRVFVLGGWLTHPSVKGFMSAEISKNLEGFDKQLFAIFADEIPGVSQMLNTDSTELVGASLLMPEYYAKE
jgi:hypothetical protein